MKENDQLNIKIGDMIQSDTSGCGIIIGLPNNLNIFEYTINWNRGDIKEWDVHQDSVKVLVKYGKWKVIPL